MQAFYCVRRGGGKEGEREGEVMKEERRGEESSCRGMQRRDWNSLSSSLWHVCWTRVCFLCLHWKKHTHAPSRTLCPAADVQMMDAFGVFFFFFSLPIASPVKRQSFASDAFITHRCCAFYHATHLTLEIRKTHADWPLASFFFFYLLVRRDSSLCGLVRWAFLMCTQRAVKVKEGSFKASIWYEAYSAHVTDPPLLSGFPLLKA